MARSAAPLRLLCVSHYFESHRGGIEMVAGRLARSLTAADVDVAWAATDASAVPDDLASICLPASNLIERHSGLPFPIPGARALLRLIKAVRESDIVLAHDGMYLTSIAALVAARVLRKPAVLVQHIGYVPANSTVLRLLFAVADRFLTRPMLRLASQVVFISKTTADHFADVRARREPTLIFNGVDAQVFRPSRSSNERTRERAWLGWPGERPVVLFVGRFLEKKGLMRLREMALARTGIHWVFAGWGPCDPEMWDLPNVSVCRDRSGPSLAPLYRCADLLVLPSKSEGFPLVVQEALACGLRAVCCDDAAKADPAVTPILTGITNDQDESAVVSAYVTAIDRLLAAPDAKQGRDIRAQFARERYSWEAAAVRYRRVFSALQRPRGSAARRQRVAA